MLRENHKIDRCGMDASEHSRINRDLLSEGDSSEVTTTSVQHDTLVNIWFSFNAMVLLYLCILIKYG